MTLVELKDMDFQEALGFEQQNYKKWERIPTIKKPQLQGKNRNINARVKRQSDAEKMFYEEEEKRKSERITSIKVNDRKEDIRGLYKKRKDRTENCLNLKKEIEQEESSVFGEVKAVLRKYEKMKIGMSYFNHAVELKEAEKEFKKTNNRLKSELKVLQDERAASDKKLKEKTTEYNNLVSYKHKHYPTMVIQAESLKDTIAVLNFTNKEDMEELEHMINAEVVKYKKDQAQAELDVAHLISEKMLYLMQPELKSMFLQNIFIKREIEFHKEEKVLLEKIVAELEKEVGQLLADPRIHQRLYMFPELYPKDTQCTPDMDVTLDISLQKWIPL